MIKFLLLLSVLVFIGWLIHFLVVERPRRRIAREERQLALEERKAALYEQMLRDHPQRIVQID